MKFRLANRNQRFPAWQYTLLATVSVVAVVGLICGLEPWVIWQRMLIAGGAVIVISVIVDFWFSTVFDQ